MPIEPALDPAKTAVLSMDMQAGIVSIYAGGDEGFTSRAAQVLGKCRDRGFTVIHVQVGFRPGLPEVSPRNALFSAIRTNPQRQQLFQGDAGKIHPAVAPVGEDIVIVKHRISAFTGTDLDMILRAKEIDTLVMFGIATSGVVLSTLLDAVDADYRAVVIKDCCADQDADVHSILLEKFFPRRGTVVSSAELLESLSG
ncbi:MAG: isochorismatase family cysteine hydrolase [Acidobacteriaceae bacterium]